MDKQVLRLEIQPRSGLEVGHVLEDNKGQWLRLFEIIKHPEQIKYVDGNKDVVFFEIIPEKDRHKYKLDSSYIRDLKTGKLYDK